MAYNENGYKATAKYKANKIKRVPLDMQIEDYEKLKEVAGNNNEPVNSFIKLAIKERIERVVKDGEQIEKT